MTDGTNSGGGIGTGWALIILWTALAYFVYDGIEGAIAVVILGVLFGLAILIALIPFCGVVIQVLVMYFLIWPWVSNFTGIEATWLTLLIFWVDVILGIFITLVTTLVAIVIIANR